MNILGQKEVIKAVEISADQDLPALLIGDTGCGKTTIVREIAKKHDKEFIRFNLTGETSVDEFVGKYVLLGGETIWQDGVLLQAMRRGAWILVDEVNAALPEILFVLQSLLDDDKFIVLSHKDGEVVRPHEDFRFFAAMNPVSEYAGTKELNKSFLSRFTVVLNVEYPNKSDERGIIEAQGGVSHDDAFKIVEVGSILREKKLSGDLYFTCSTRDLIHWAKLTRHMGIEKGFTYAILNKAAGEGEELIKEVYEKVISAFSPIESKKKELGVEDIASLIIKLDKEIDKNKAMGKKYAKKLEEVGVEEFKKFIRQTTGVEGEENKEGEIGTSSFFGGLIEPLKTPEDWKMVPVSGGSVSASLPTLTIK